MRSNDAYLVVWTHVGAIGARYRVWRGRPPGCPTASQHERVRAGKPVRWASRALLQINACLISWIEESPFAARIDNGSPGPQHRRIGSVSDGLLSSLLNTLALSSSAPDVAYSSASNEFLVAWTAFGAWRSTSWRSVSAPLAFRWRRDYGRRNRSLPSSTPRSRTTRLRTSFWSHPSSTTGRPSLGQRSKLEPAD